MGQETDPGDAFTKAFRIVVPVLVVVAMALLVLFAYLLTQPLPLPSLPESDPIPHSRFKAVEGRLHDMPEPVEFQVLGNASASQYLAVVAEGGSLLVYVSNDTFVNNVTMVLLEERYGTDPATVTLALGHDPAGRVAVGVTRGAERKGWVLERWPDVWTPIEGPLEISVPASPRVEAPSLPSPDNMVGWPDGWDTLVLGDRNVAVGSYRYQAGCMEESCSPSVVFVTDDGDWSTIVVLGRQWADLMRVAGSGLDDMFMVSVDQDDDGTLWYITVVDREGILETGQAPPQTGLG